MIAPLASALPMSVQARITLTQRLADWRSAQAQGHAGPGTPCIAVCRMDTRTRLCLGCLRHIDEIADWGLLPDADRALIWHRLEERLHRLGPQGTGSDASTPADPPP